MAIELPNPQQPPQLLTPKSHHSLKQTHAQIIKQCRAGDSYIAGTLIKHYDSDLHSALKVFDQVPQPHVFLWNALIRSSLSSQNPHLALSSFALMLSQGSKPNNYTFPPLFKACALAGARKPATQLHAHVAKCSLQLDRHIASAGIQMYAAFGMLAEARRMLGTGVGLDVVCWNSMIDGCMRNGELKMAKELFDEMPERDVGSWNAMVSGYARRELIEESRRVFDEMPERNDVSWSAMIDGYMKSGRPVDALETFRRMLVEAVIPPTKFVFSTVLAACADVGALEQGRWIHAYIRRNGISIDAVLGTALIDMYSKSGSFDSALEVFDRMSQKEVFTWNSMIGGAAMNGHARLAIELFDRMKREEFKPDSNTFVGLLNGCAHSGFVEEGYNFFHCMVEEHGVKPMVEHYGCMVDLLGRAGWFDEAEGLIESMPMKPNAAVWGALLGGCQIHANVKLAERVGKILLELEPENSGRYALLSNIYARAGRWEDVAEVRKLMKDRGIGTIPGKSSIELEGIVHEFVVGDSSQSNAKDTRFHHFRDGLCSCMEFW